MSLRRRQCVVVVFSTDIRCCRHRVFSSDSRPIVVSLMCKPEPQPILSYKKALKKKDSTPLMSANYKAMRLPPDAYGDFLRGVGSPIAPSSSCLSFFLSFFGLCRAPVSVHVRKAPTDAHLLSCVGSALWDAWIQVQLELLETSVPETVSRGFDRRVYVYQKKQERNIQHTTTTSSLP